VAGIGHGQRLARVWHAVAGKDRDAFRGGERIGIEPELMSESLIQPDEAGPGNRGRWQTGKEALR